MCHTSWPFWVQTFDLSPWLSSDHIVFPVGISAWSQFFLIWQQHSVTMLNPNTLWEGSLAPTFLKKWPKYFLAEGDREQLEWGHLRVYDVYQIFRRKRNVIQLLDSEVCFHPDDSIDKRKRATETESRDDGGGWKSTAASLRLLTISLSIIAAFMYFQSEA